MGYQLRRMIRNKQHNDTPEARERLAKYLAERGRLDLLAPPTILPRRRR